MTDKSAGTGCLVWAGEDSEHIRVRSVIGFVRTDVAAWKAAVERFAVGDLRGEDELRRLGVAVRLEPVLLQAGNSRAQRPSTQGGTHAHDGSDLDAHRLDDRRRR